MASNANSPIVLGDIINKLVGDNSASNLIALKCYSPLKTVRLQAAWRIITSKNDARNDVRAALRREFVGFVEGTIANNLEYMWKHCLLLNESGNDVGNWAITDNMRYKNSELGVYIANDITVTKAKNGDWVFKEQDRSVSVKQKLLSSIIEYASAVSHYSMHIHGSTLYIVGFDSNNPYFIVAVDTANSKICWRGSVFGVGIYVTNGMRLHRHAVLIRRVREEILVYGFHSTGLYLDVFNARTGKCVLRFATTAWNR